MEEEDKVEDWDGSDNDQQDVQAPLNATYTYKIIIVGDSNVGKTCLAWRFCSGQFLNKTAATIGVDFQEKAIELEGEKIKVNLYNIFNDSKRLMHDPMSILLPGLSYCIIYVR